jgi:mannose-6-phosphate isomerase-like protein (cupin superfamily)
MLPVFLLKSKPERHSKAWGYEDWIINNNNYCAKILHFNLGAKFSLHFHILKHETWYVSKGEFEITLVDTATAQKTTFLLKEGDVIVIEPGHPHQLKALTEGAEIFETSTTHFDTDSYRIEPGDSQN